MYKVNCWEICAFSDDFDGNMQGWKNAVYSVWQFQMEHAVAYEIALSSHGRHGAMLYIVAKEAWMASLMGKLEELGFRDVDYRMTERVVISRWSDDFAYERVFE